MNKIGTIVGVISLFIALGAWLLPADKWLYGGESSLGDQQTILEFHGVGKAGSNFSNDAIRKRAATRAAELDADRQFAEWKKGNRVTSMSLVNNLELTEDEIRSTINAQTGGLLTVKSSYDLANGAATVVKQVKVVTDKE